MVCVWDQPPLGFSTAGGWAGVLIPKESPSFQVSVMFFLLFVTESVTVSVFL